jgi:hypothetical protein
VPSWVHRVADASAYIPVLAAALALLAGIRTVYRRTLGRRRDRYERIARLGTNANASFFTSVIGEPPAIRRGLTGTFNELVPGTDEFRAAQREYWESVWIDRDFYVHAFSKQEDDAIVAFSVTTRHRRFHPRLVAPGYTVEERSKLMRRLGFSAKNRPLFDVRLGRTTFGELGPPGSTDAWVGAHNMYYSEAHWYGNPGNYQWYVFSVNDAGVYETQDVHMIGTVMSEDGQWDFAWGFGSGTDPPYEAMHGWQQFRQRARINTYTVLAPSLLLHDYPPGGDLTTHPTRYGPSSEHVRTVP